MHRLTAAFIVLLLALIVPGPAFAGQLETDEGDGDGCQVGELCGSTEFEDAEQSERQVVDPPGDHVTSLVTLGCIAAVVGSYLFAALTGRNPLSRLAARRRAG